MISEGMIEYILLSLLLASFCITAPTEQGIRFDKRDGALPTLTLPYGTWQATKFDPNGNVSFDFMFTVKLDVHFADLFGRYIPSKTFVLGRLQSGN